MLLPRDFVQHATMVVHDRFCSDIDLAGVFYVVRFLMTVFDLDVVVVAAVALESYCNGSLGRAQAS